MGMSLADALGQVDLEPSRLYRERVNGRAPRHPGSESAAVTGQDDEAGPEPASGRNE